MKHQTKTRILKFLNYFPNQIGDWLYHFMQQVGSKETVEKKIKSTQSSYNLIKNLLEANGIDIKDKTVAEIGSGWVPLLPYHLVLDGKAKRVLTFDINEHYNKKEIAAVNNYFSTYYNRELAYRGKYDLIEEVVYFPKTDITGANLQDVDLIVSRFVLEHVPPNVIRDMHSSFFKKLKKGSYVLHLISPSDHRAYTDSSLSLQDFLRYSKDEWDQVQTRFDYHNRLRLPEYKALLSEKFEIVFLEHDKINFSSESYQKFKQLRLHEDYRAYSEQELMAGSINVLLKKT